MVVDSLKVFLFGMAGIFAVMGVIILMVSLLNNLTRRSKKDDSEISG